MTAFTDALVPAAGIHSHLMTNGGGCPTAFADALILVPAAGIDSPLLDDQWQEVLDCLHRCLGIPAAGIHSHLMTNGGGCPTAFASALVPVAECIMPRFGPRFLRNFRALGSAHYYSITCSIIVTSCNNKQINTDELSSSAYSVVMNSRAQSRHCRVFRTVQYEYSHCEVRQASCSRRWGLPRVGGSWRLRTQATMWM